MIDLRSDTITKPTPEMLEAMMTAEVGDDVFGDDPTVNALQEKTAKMFGMEDALYCPSGTMTNQIAMRIHTRPQDEVICHKHSHVYLYEGGGMMYNSMLSPKLLMGDRGRITADQVSESINPDDIHFPKSKLVVLENTMNKGGGSIYDIEEIKKIRKVCDDNELKLHLDGARFFNALVKTGENPKEYGKLFDTISICFSKGLGAPVGSVLLGTKDQIKEAKRVRKVFGGGMRQAGYLAAACTYALDHHIDRLAEDHLHAKKIGEVLKSLPFIEEVMPVDTNIVIGKLVEGKSEKWLLDELEKQGIRAVGFGKGLIRFVTHRDFTSEDLDKFESAISKISS
ncbi:GntG family PLP-dependent aldolase [Ekhidna sp. MALMAid0563]|uniref:threonine aldolase family protein n=1 Tax=Ekhidna sp. MALMAid0563 TaxID=3143937 RepID=UPI0032DE5396